MKFCSFLIFFGFNILLTSSILIPLTTNQTRCMLVYTSSQDDTIKLMINLPQLPKANQDQDYYIISIQNTELKEIQYEKVNNGLFRRQLKLPPQIIYQICCKIVSDQSHKVQINYEDHHLFKMSHLDQKMPDSLVKTKDLQTVYRDILIIQDVCSKQIEMYNQRKNSEELNFVQIEQTNSILFYLQLISILFLILMGAIQFYVIKRHLQDSMYI